MIMRVKEWVTVVETGAFLRRAIAFLTVEEIDALKQVLANTPEIGFLIPHSGGLRKLRVSAQQKGKSGGARVIYYYHSSKMPIFLLDIYVKSRKVDLGKAELSILRKLTEQLCNTYGV
jgi:hypothetical protein